MKLAGACILLPEATLLFLLAFIRIRPKEFAKLSIRSTCPAGPYTASPGSAPALGWKEENLALRVARLATEDMYKTPSADYQQCWSDLVG